LPTSLFDQVVAASTLSPIFAKGALARSLQRAGITMVNLDMLTKSQLKIALPEIKKTLQSFLGDRANDVLKAIEEMAN
jgi:hypothetical protein